MKDYTSEEIQKISSSFRSIARRLLRTDVEQSDANLKRFMSFIEDCELIMDYILENNTTTYDIPKMLKARGWLNPFEISSIQSEEIAFEYQLLKFAVDERGGDFSSLYYPVYIHAKATANDSARDFIGHIIDPLVDYIADFLKQKYECALRNEGKGTSNEKGTVNAHNSTILVNSPVVGNVMNQVVIDSSTVMKSSEIIRQIEDVLPEYQNQEGIPELVEILGEIKEEIAQGKKTEAIISDNIKNTRLWIYKNSPIGVEIVGVIWYIT